MPTANSQQPTANSQQPTANSQQPTANSQQFNLLIQKLKEIFQINRPDLDFGIYRILNTRATEIEQFLSVRLPNIVQQQFNQSTQQAIVQWQQQLIELKQQLISLGIEPENNEKYQQLNQQIKNAVQGQVEQQNDIYTHLLTFFSRYYDNGDFISQRRYKDDTYAIPYSGEEVMLHWANKDQYYTKSGENFSNYRFKLSDGRQVFFRLIEADTAKDNRKDNDISRLFVLSELQYKKEIDENGDEIEVNIFPIQDNGQELVILFEYKAMPKSTKQVDLIEQAIQTIQQNVEVQARWQALFELAPTEKDPNRTVLKKQLSDYTQKNTADYFIHKDLGRFLSQELDFYIKNEVMNLDNIQTVEDFKPIETQLTIIKTLRQISLQIIAFLAQLENFQKKLWLKKKFVTDCHYLVTLNYLREDEKLGQQILTNHSQLEQWKTLFNFDASGQNWQNLCNTQPYLVVDTSLFSAAFQADLLRHFDNLDYQTDGVIIHSDNFQALNLLQARYKEQVECIYIDPPYNTDSAPIAYKNNYKDSSWNSLLYCRYKLSSNLLKNDGICITAIDDIELRYLYTINDSIWGRSNYIGSITTLCNPQGRVSNKMSKTSEYHLFYTKNIEDIKYELRVEKLENKTKDTPLKRTGTNSRREERPLRYFPIFYKNNQLSLPTDEEYKEIYNNNTKIFNDDFLNSLNMKYLSQGYQIIYPLKDNGEKLVWQRTFTRVKEDIHKYIYRNGTIYTPPFEDEIPRTTWTDPLYANPKYGTELVKEILGNRYLESIQHKISLNTAKSIHTVKQMINTNKQMINTNILTLDYFAGSGTTAHAVINLNREDQGKRKYILVEQGEYFDTVLKPRIQKVVYSENWKDGEPVENKELNHFNGVPQLVKVLKLESYEDTLNNLKLQKPMDLVAQGLSEDFQQDYLLHYMIDVESRDSLLNTDDFKKPFDYQLNISTCSVGCYQNQKIDLIETFHYLIGLRVHHINDQRHNRHYVWIEGKLPNENKALIIWRDCEYIGYQELTELFNKHRITPKDNEFDVIYINGDHNITTVYADNENEMLRTLKIRPIEPEFLHLMFES